MADQRNGGIAWTEETWNPLRGCTRVSAGCMNCYAESMAVRFCGFGQPYEGTINPETKRWNGTVRLVPEKLTDPLRWQRPRMVFVNSMSDLFHESVPDEFINQVFAVMALAKQHTFQVLTKRPERMLNYLRSSAVRDQWVRAGDTFADTMEPLHYANLSHIGKQGNLVSVFSQWPLPNVWLGVTVENQQAADERIPLLLQTPAAVRWVSIEPLLGAVDLMRLNTGRLFSYNALSWMQGKYAGIKANSLLDWIVVGGESGHNARPMHPDWVRSLRDQCADAGVPFLFKQWGEFSLAYDRDLEDPDFRMCDKMGKEPGRWINLAGGHGFHGERVHYAERVGKKAAGRLLDGVQHDGYPAFLKNRKRFYSELSNVFLKKGKSDVS